MSGTIDANQQLTITLPASAWNNVLGLVAKGPWDVADPLMQAIRQQIAEQIKAAEAPA